MTNFDATFHWLKDSVSMQLIGSRRKDGRPSSKEIKIKDVLTNLEIFVNEKIRLIQALPSDQSNANKALEAVNKKIDITLASLQKENFLTYDQRLVLNQLAIDTSHEALKDVLISQSDGSRSGYLGEKITGPNGLASKSGYSFSVYSSDNKRIDPLMIKEPVAKTSIEGQRLPIPPAVKDAAERIGTLVKNNFGCDSDQALCILINELAKEGYEKTNQVNVENIVKQLGLYDDSITILNHYRSLFIPPSGMGHLPAFFIDRQTWYPDMSEKGNYVVSKSRYEEPDEYPHEDRITMSELKETLVDFAFLVAALDLKKPVYGSCQGAHVGWLLAGGEMVKWNKYKLHTGMDTIESVRNLGEQHELDDNVAKATLDDDKYGSDEYVKVPLKNGTEVFALTDYDHATVMYKRDGIELKNGTEIILAHVLSVESKRQLEHVKNNSTPRTRSVSPTSIVQPDSSEEMNALQKQNALQAKIEIAEQKQNALQAKIEIAEQTIFEVAENAVEYFTYKTLSATQSHYFKHLENPNSCAFVLEALGLAKGKTLTNTKELSTQYRKAVRLNDEEAPSNDSTPTLSNK